MELGKKNTRFTILFIFIGALITLFLVSIKTDSTSKNASITEKLESNQSIIREDYWPTSDWRISTPEEQGIDSAVLTTMLREIEMRSEIRSVLVIRHGYLILESYRAPYNRDTGVNVKSVSKSIMSALAGIAIRENYIKSVDQKVADFYPEYFNHSDFQKKEITIQHLLTMTAGLHPKSDMSIPEWSESKDWLKATLDEPLKSTPGSSFDYNTGLTHLMSAIIAKSSGMTTLDFGKKYLFDPLGITIEKWSRDPQGIYIGGCELNLTPRDMAKFGYLYLHNGIWNGQQLIPKEWIENSVKNQLKQGSGYNAGPDYGYWWWLTKEDYQARGWGGQYIIVNPKLDMVVVFTAADFIKPLQILKSHIYEAVKSNTSLPPNPGAVAAMQKNLEKLATPGNTYTSPSSKIMEKLNGKTYHCQKNELGITSFTLSFKDTDCTFRYTQSDHQGNEYSSEFPVGLNGRYRFTPLEDHVTYFGCNKPLLPINEPGGIDKYPVAFEGHWGDENCFLVNWLYPLDAPVRFQVVFTFYDDEVNIRLTMPPTRNCFNINGFISYN